MMGLVSRVLFMPVASSWHHSGTVAAHHAFLGCAYFERFHNQKIKAFFRETMYAETREKIVINWVLSKARVLAVAFFLLIFLGFWCCVFVLILRSGYQGQRRLRSCSHRFVRFLLSCIFLFNICCSYSASEENLYQIGCREKAAVFDAIVRCPSPSSPFLESLKSAITFRLR
jgi:hypothetical protein